MIAHPTRSIRLYRSPVSGHCHRVELFLNLLGLPYELHDIDLAGGAHKQPEFVKLNPWGEVPVLDDDGVILADSNAILVYLATRYDDGCWLPRDPVRAAQVQGWLSIAAGQIKNGPCNARLVNLVGAKYDHGEAKQISNALFAVLDPILRERRFLIGDQITIADISAYAYIAHAPEGGVSLEPYTAICAWQARIEAIPGFLPMRRTKIGLNAT
jgi:glutathione S-transferase